MMSSGKERWRERCPGPRWMLLQYLVQHSHPDHKYLHIIRNKQKNVPVFCFLCETSITFIRDYMLSEGQAALEEERKPRMVVRISDTNY